MPEQDALIKAAQDALAARNAEIDALRDEATARDAEIAGLKTEMAELKIKVAELEAAPPSPNGGHIDAETLTAAVRAELAAQKKGFMVLKEIPVTDEQWQKIEPILPPVA